MATKTRPCIVLYKATGNPREMCNYPIGVAGFCIASFLNLQSGNNNLHCIVSDIIFLVLDYSSVLLHINHS